MAGMLSTVRPGTRHRILWGRVPRLAGGRREGVKVNCRGHGEASRAPADGVIGTASVLRQVIRHAVGPPGRALAVESRMVGPESMMTGQWDCEQGAVMFCAILGCFGSAATVPRQSHHRCEVGAERYVSVQ
jgi:hypothetical protein